MYKLVALDLDGTLFNSQSQVSERNITAIKNCHKHKIDTVVATGRPPRFTFGHIPSLLASDYTVCYNGAQIYHNSQLILERCMNHGLIVKIIDFVLSHKDIKMALESRDVIYSNFDMKRVWPNIESCDIDDLADYDHICKVIILNKPGFDDQAFIEDFKKECNVILTDGGKLIEIVDKNVSKLTAIKWIAEREGIDINEVVAFGDDLNDMEIIQHVGLGVAMLNGHDQIKAASNYVTDTNDKDGVALVLEKIIEDKS